MAEGTTQESARGRLLLVDDEDSIRRVLGAILKRRGIDVVTAATGDEAIKVLEQKKSAVDWALVDLHLPDMNGMALAEELRTLSPSMQVMLASGELGDACKSELPARMTFIQKPFTVDQVLERLKRVPGKRDV
jgi:DNA-binding NtrC family response regulator